MSELKPCPFCGGEALLRERYIQGIANRKHYRRECRHCKATFADWYRSMKKADEAWNRRVQPANETLTLEQLREMEQRGEGIYVTHADGSPIFRGKQYTAAVLDRIAAFGAMGYHLQAIYGRGLTLAEDDCGKTWLAYAHKSGGEQE